jgi:hypothetical protein
MNRIPPFAQPLLLACTALAFAFAGCTSDQANTGGIDASLTLDADAVVKHITTVTVTIDCDGIDPITGLPWPSETFDVNVNTSEGNDPTDPKDSLGVFKKEGLPEGNCTVTITAVSDDGTMTCAGQLVDIAVVAGPTNTFVTVIINCITDARYGGIGVDGEFNQCSEYSQIIVSPTTQSTGGEAVDVQIWCYDPDGSIDDPLAAVLFITAASSVDPNPTNWIACGSNPAYQFPPIPVPCPHQDPPTLIGAQSTDLDLFCNIGDDGNGDPGTPCVVIVSISDDGFAAGGTDPFGCDGTDDNANAVIPVFCQSLAVCGNGVIESPETCDPPSGATANPSGDWCNSVCKLFDPCDNPLIPPANCPAPSDPQCQTLTCSENSGVISCGIVNVPAGTVCGSDGQCTSSGSCAEGACTNIPDSTYVCTDGSTPPTIKDTITACGVCNAVGFACPNDCSGDPIAPGTPAAECISRTLLLGGDGGACTSGLSGACLSCYTDYAACGASACGATSCSGAGATGPDGCQCLDCMEAACGASFAACAGYGLGAPDSDDGSGAGTIGGPPICEGIPTPACDTGGASCIPDCDDGNECTTAVCQQPVGPCTNDPAPAGTPCGPGLLNVCDGAGVCTSSP